MYTRSAKVQRARQLGFDYPRELDGEVRASAMQRIVSLPNTAPVNVLFVCSMNQWRSPTAERVFGSISRFRTRSGGTSTNARHPVSIDDIQWADAIFAMEEKHAQRLRATFARALTNKTLHVLDIPDDYRFMDEELVDMLLQAVADALGSRI